MRVDPQPFDVWLKAKLRERYGEAERLPEEWITLVDKIRHPD